jgi:DNA-binding response OmpR family regulator
MVATTCAAADDGARSVLSMPGSVLVVEDDALIASSLVRALEANGYDATTVGTVATAIVSIDAEPPDLVLLDLGLPDGDGAAVAVHAAREHPTVPVIVLTARDSEVDVVLGLEAGAVDYVVKPFRLAELLARIASHLRMREAHTQRAGGGVIELDDLSVDIAARRVTVEGSEIALRPKEFDVIRVLAESAGAAVTRERLIDEVWDENWWGSTKTLDVHINSIRRKLGEQAGAPSRITTIRGVGYRLERERPTT